MENINIEIKNEISQLLSNSPKPISLSEVTESLKTKEALSSYESNEVIILPTPPKPKPLLITIDDSEENKTPQNSVNNSKSISSATDYKGKETQKKNLCSYSKKGPAQNKRSKKSGKNRKSTKDKNTNICNQYSYNSSSRWDKYPFYSVSSTSTSRCSAQNKNTSIHNQYTYRSSRWDSFHSSIYGNMLPFPNYQVWNASPVTYPILNNRFQYGLFSNNVLMNNNVQYGAYRPPVSNNSSRYNLDNSHLLNSNYQAAYQSSVNVASNFNYNNNLDKNLHLHLTANKLIEKLSNVSQLSSHQNTTLVNKLNQPVVPNVSTDKNCNISQLSSQRYDNSVGNFNLPSAANYSEKEKFNDASQLPSHQNTSLVNNLNQPVVPNVNTDKNCNISQLSSQRYDNSVGNLNLPSAANYSEREKFNDASQLPSQENTSLVNNLNQPVVPNVNTDKNCNISQLSSQQYANTVENLNQPSTANYSEREKFNDASQLPSRQNTNPVTCLNQSLMSNVNTEKYDNDTQSSQHFTSSVGNLSQPSSANYSEKETSSQQLANSEGNLNLPSVANYSERGRFNNASLLPSQQNNILVNFNQLLVSNVKSGKNYVSHSSSGQHTSCIGNVTRPSVYIASTDKNHSNTRELNENRNSLEHSNNKKQINDSNAIHPDNAKRAQETNEQTKIAFKIHYKQTPNFIQSSHFTNDAIDCTDIANSENENCLSNQLASDFVILNKNKSKEINSKQMSKIVQKSVISKPDASAVVCTNISSTETTLNFKQNGTASVKETNSVTNSDFIDVDKSPVSVDTINLASLLTVLLENASEKSSKICEENYHQKSPQIEKNERSMSCNSQKIAERKSPVIESISEGSSLSKVNEKNKFNSSETNHKSPSKSSVHINSENSEKRKNTFETNNAKKQKACDTENFKVPNASKKSEEICLNNDPPNFLTNAKVSNSVSSVMLPANQEISFPSENQAEDVNSITTSTVKKRKDCVNDSSTSVVERTVGSGETISDLPLNSNTQNSKIKSSTRNIADKENMNCINKKSVESVFVGDNKTDASRKQRVVASVNSSLLPFDHSANPSSMKSLDGDLKKIFNLTPCNTEYWKKLPRHPDLLLKELCILASHERTIKQCISNTGAKIEDYMSMLKKCKRDEMRLYMVKEDLNKKRHFVKMLLRSIKKKNSVIKKNPKRLSQMCLGTNQPVNSTLQNVNIVENTSKISHTSQTKMSPEHENWKSVSTKPKQLQTTVGSTCKSFRSANTSELSERQGQIKTPVPEECGEVVILPPPIKQPPPLIILDEEEGSTTVNQCSRRSLLDIHQSAKQITNTSLDNGLCVFDRKRFSAHSEPINKIVVFEDYLYTCSNDSTAKRFSLQDSSVTVTYFHTAKNVINIVVEKINSVTIVCTYDSNNVISLFLALNGIIIKSFGHDCPVTSICKGWGKIYSGLIDGDIHIYSWHSKHQLSPLRNVVKTGHPISCIATTYEGHLPFLIVLSTDGQIFLRGAETATLIRCIDEKVEIPSLLTIYKNSAYFYSSYNLLSVLNFVTRKIEKKLYVDGLVTGIAANDDYLFTICENTGVVTCNKTGTESDRKMYYGAGKKNLTCMHLHNNWVFTGSNKGSISAFKFDPHSSEVCKFKNCGAVYGSKEDLIFHVKNDHIPHNARCYWNNCVISFRKDEDIKVKMKHMKMHIF